jgi:hypothetical protein
MTRSIGMKVMAVPLIVALVGLPAIAQTANRQAAARAEAQSATHVSAEMVKGRLSPGASKPGDQFALRLNEDMKSNGEVVMKKGTTITGVVKNVKRAEGNSSPKGQAQSMMEIEWLTPPAQGRTSKQIMIAMQSISYTNPIYAHGQQASDADFALVSSAAASGAAGSGGGLAGGVLGGATSTVTSIAAGAGATVGSVASGTTARTHSSNAALLSMPTVMAADSNTSAALQNTFGMSSSEPLFKTGHGEVVSAGGSKSNIDIFSHFSNDTVLTSPSNNFEISSGAQMQLLVGVQK